MKAVLPALTGKGYGHMANQVGDRASKEFWRVTFGEVPKVERQRVRRQLEDYCGQDTEGMIWIVDALADLKRRWSEVQQRWAAQGEGAEGKLMLTLLPNANITTAADGDLRRSQQEEYCE